MAKKDTKDWINYFMNKSNDKDLIHLSSLLDDQNNLQQFENYIKTNYLIDSTINSFNTKKAKQQYLEFIKKEKKQIKLKKRLKRISYASAAVLIGIALSLYLVNSITPKKENFNNDIPIIVNNTIKTGTSKAILTLENGEKISLSNGVSQEIQSATSNGKEIVYNGKGIGSNTLTIPRGGQFFVQLVDGTKIWLNSETQIKYPVNFVKGKERKIELIYGEIYLEVSHSTNHGGSNFIVFNQNQEIEVLGTKFNIKAYTDENIIYTSLVSGKVALKLLNTQMYLSPGEQTQLNKQNGKVVKQKINVYNTISWHNGNFDFNYVELNEIMHVLSRWYNMEVTFKNVKSKKERFSGRLNKNHSIEEIMSSIKAAEIINNYEINGNNIIIK